MQICEMFEYKDPVQLCRMSVKRPSEPLYIQLNDYLKKHPNYKVSDFQYITGNDRFERLFVVFDVEEPVETKEYTAEMLMKVITEKLDELKKLSPNKKVIIETPGSTVSCELRNALIYEGMNNELVFDAE